MLLKKLFYIFAGAAGLFLLGSLFSSVYLEYKGTLAKPKSVELPDSFQQVLTEVDFLANDGQRLKAWYSPGHNGSVIVLLHGYGDTRLQMLPDADLLIRNGFGVFLFDSRAHGESQGSYITYGLSEAHDLSSALDWLLTRPGTDPEKLAALGFSNGAVALAHHAYVDRRLSSVILRSMPSSLFDLTYDEGGPPGEAEPWRWALTHLRLWAISWTASINAYESDAENIISNISPRPILLVVGAKDNVVPAYRSRKLWEAARNPKSILVLPDTGHGKIAEADKQLYEDSLLKFLHGSLSIQATVEPQVTSY